jgi:hypothetical protein
MKNIADYISETSDLYKAAHSRKFGTGANSRVGSRAGSRKDQRRNVKKGALESRF